jgi:hypothetical protein
MSVPRGTARAIRRAKEQEEARIERAKQRQAELKAMALQKQQESLQKKAS